MKKVFAAFLLILGLGSLPAGQASLFAQSFIAQINPYPTGSNNSSALDTIKILAVMVSFQEDRDGTTFGNGKFGSIYTENYGNDILDPLPHDQAYFESHLQFVQNYFKKVSENNLYIEFTILPDTFSVSQRMREYSPDPGSDDFTSVADFSVEAWTLADGMYPGFDFSSYNLFTIFHAGVGRDLSLPGSIGNERDLPSVYLSEKAFKDIYGESFDGIPVSGGAFKITNSMIMPETESRELNTIVGTFLFEITINGLLCASVGSHLGLPDLFDTETGLSAIGRFGLMDGQGIFAYAGTYPPEPSPWSKIKMGWAEPVTMKIENANVNLVTNLAAGIGDTVILKIPLNSSEYYLVENRNRDANNDGSTVTYNVGGNVITRTFYKDTTGYQSFDVDSLIGVITDVDEFDWAVPGNGILIWHIDENIIAEKIEENAINTDKDRRGVDIEEADGVQDIGVQFQTILGDIVIGEGTEEDLWHASNPTKLFENRFAKDTRPNILTNSGANSLITIKDFSEIDKRMSFNVEFGDSIIKPLFTYQLQSIPRYLSSTEFNNKTYFFTGSPSLFNVLIGDSLYYQSLDFSISKPAIIVDNNTLFAFGGYSSKELNYWMTDGTTLSTGQVTAPSFIYTPLVINKSLSSGNELWFGCGNGKIYKYMMGSFPNTPPELKDSIVIDDGYSPFKIAVFEDYYAIISFGSSSPTQNSSLFTSPDGSPLIDLEDPAGLALTKDKDGNFVSIVFTQQGFFHVIADGEIVSSFNSTTLHTPTAFSLSDLKRDGNNYIAINSNSEIVTYNLNGSIGDNFPATFENEFIRNVNPVSVDFEGDGNSEIISVSFNGDIFAVDGGTGQLVPGFPISIGDTIAASPSIFNYNGMTSLIVANKSGLLQAWVIGSVEGDISWKEQFADNQNSSFIPAAENTNRINDFFPSGRAYNYPNPVYDGETFIRYYVSEDSKINIKIFDLAGDYVAELNDDAQGGMDNETKWSVTDIQSGVYLARIEATSNSGKSEYAIIKIAVVK
jgi:M6 family metalloprotease-like protein